ncbi:uncharacterized protein G2W53_027526 [Senna tora]|uniref:Uncharacterized protein n=1 Tax=Senna tora TaxID=362788 RepID=A0A834TJN3_9FABA|nr:uncharacterized protein G2W53_027526 [Senna tora]
MAPQYFYRKRDCKGGAIKYAWRNRLLIQ